MCLTVVKRFNQAIDLCGEVWGCQIHPRKKLIQSTLDEISMDTGKFCFGVDDTIKAMELGAVETFNRLKTLTLIDSSH